MQLTLKPSTILSPPSGYGGLNSGQSCLVSQGTGFIVHRCTSTYRGAQMAGDSHGSTSARTTWHSGWHVETHVPSKQ